MLASGPDQLDSPLPDRLLTVGDHGQQELIRMRPERVPRQDTTDDLLYVLWLVTEKLYCSEEIFGPRRAQLVPLDGAPDRHVMAHDESDQRPKNVRGLLRRDIQPQKAGSQRQPPVNIISLVRNYKTNY